jgi:hypothetical protein
VRELRGSFRHPVLQLAQRTAAVGAPRRLLVDLVVGLLNRLRREWGGWEEGGASGIRWKTVRIGIRCMWGGRGEARVGP